MLIRLEIRLTWNLFLLLHICRWESCHLEEQEVKICFKVEHWSWPLNHDKHYYELIWLKTLVQDLGIKTPHTYHHALRQSSRYLHYLELNLSWTSQVYCKIDCHHIRDIVDFWIISPIYTKRLLINLRTFSPWLQI